MYICLYILKKLLRCLRLSRIGTLHARANIFWPVPHTQSPRSANIFWPVPHTQSPRGKNKWKQHAHNLSAADWLHAYSTRHALMLFYYTFNILHFQNKRALFNMTSIHHARDAIMQYTNKCRAAGMDFSVVRTGLRMLTSPPDSYSCWRECKADKIVFSLESMLRDCWNAPQKSFLKDVVWQLCLNRRGSLVQSGVVLASNRRGSLVQSGVALGLYLVWIGIEPLWS